MKFQLRLAIFLFIFSKFNLLMSQPIISKSVVPQIGDTILLAMDTVLMNPGNAGASQTWNFTNLSAKMISTRLYVAPSSTPYAAQFTNAMLSKTDGLHSVYSYWNLSDTNASYVGFVEPNIYDQSFSPAISFYRYPIHYNDAYSLTAMATTNPGALQGSVKYYFIADAYGVLNLPRGGLTNVLRTHSTIYVGDSNVNSYSLTNEYAWYKDGVKEPIMVIGKVIINGSVHKKYVFYENGYHRSGISESTIDVEFSIYPNPVLDVFNIQCNEKINRISIYTIQGEEVMLQTTNLNSIDMHSLASGIYIIRCEGNNFIRTQKIIKQ